MGKMAEPTDDERLERRKLAHAIVKSVEEDEPMPLDAVRQRLPAARSINAEYEEACAALAQEIVMLERFVADANLMIRRQADHLTHLTMKLRGQRHVDAPDHEPIVESQCPSCLGLGRVKVPVAVVTTPQEHPVLTFRKMWATLVSANADGKPYEVGDLVCIDVPLNCTIESTHSEALTRMRVAAAILAPLWPGSEVMNEDPSTCDVSGLSLVDEIVAAAKMIGDMPDA